MSLLLEALNKADKDKDATGTPSLLTTHDLLTEEKQKSTNKRLIITLISCLFVLLFILGYNWKLILKNTELTTSKSLPSETTSNKSSTAVINTIQTKSSTGIVNQTPVIPTHTNPVSAPASLDQSTIEQEEDVASLYKVNNINKPTSKTELTNQNTTTQIDSDSPSKISHYGNLPDLHDLPPEILDKIPSLNYTEHHFAQGGGYVVINGQSKHAKDSLTQGVTIENILEDGILLRAENYDFKMRALNSWVNM